MTKKLKKNCLFFGFKGIKKTVLLLKKKVILNETFCNLVNIRLLKLKECYLKSVGGDSIFNEIVFFFDFYMALFNGTHQR